MTCFWHANCMTNLRGHHMPLMYSVIFSMFLILQSIREKLFSFLDNESPLNPLLASFFSKVVGILLSRKPEPVS